MSPRARLITALVLLIATMAVCGSCYNHTTLVTAFRAAQAAAAIAMVLSLAAIARDGRMPGCGWGFIQEMATPVLPPSLTRPDLVLLC